MDKLKLYSISTMETDILNVTEKQDCKFRLYEIQRLESLKQTVSSCLESISSQVIREKLGILLHDIQRLQLSLQSNCYGPVLCNQIFKVAEKGDDLSKEIFDNYVPTLKSRIHEFTDAGPGVGVSNHDVHFRIAEVIIITNLDYYIRHHLATDDSSHNEVERIQSYAGDAICDGGSINWEYKEQYEGLSDNDLQKMSYAELESHELDRMKFNAFKVCDELNMRIDGAPAPNGFMKAYTSEKKDRLFFNNHDYVKEFLSSREKNKMTVPGCNYINSIETFSQLHMETGEKFTEFTRYSCCSMSCVYCCRIGWIGPPCQRIPKPMPNYERDGMHYLNVLDTPSETNGQACLVDDFQPRKQVKNLLESRGLSNDQQIEDFSKKYMVEEMLLVKYIQHLKILDLNKRKRAEERKISKEHKSAKSFEDYDWPALFQGGLLKKLNVRELNKYINHYHLCQSLNLKKTEKVNLITAHIASSLLQQPHVDAPGNGTLDSDSSMDELDSEDSDNDVVINETENLSADTSADESESEESDSSEKDYGEIFTTTRSGRLTTNWKRSKYVI